MLTSRSSGLCRLAATLFLSLGLAGCTDQSESSPADTIDTNVEGVPDDGAALVGPYDGVYTVSFISNGIQAALGILHVESSQFDGDLASVFNEVFAVSGYITEYGEFVFEPITGNFGSEVVAEGQIDNGLINGTYTIDDREGFFTGSLGDSPFELYPVTEFDGTYEAALIFQGEEISQTTFIVEEGKFEAVVVTTEDAEFELRGFVTSDGTIVISQLQGDAETSELLAEGNIDHETREVFGMYRVGGFTGNVVGRIAD